MRNTPIGIAMMNDERPHVWSLTEELNMQIVNRWAEAIRAGLKNVDGSGADVVVGSEAIKKVRTAQKVGEELSRAGCRSIIMCYNGWNFPYLLWPFVK